LTSNNANGIYTRQDVLFALRRSVSEGYVQHGYGPMGPVSVAERVVTLVSQRYVFSPVVVLSDEQFQAVIAGKPETQTRAQPIAARPRQIYVPCEMVESANRARSTGASASVGAGV
jgi:hypothetical protein